MKIVLDFPVIDDENTRAILRGHGQKAVDAFVAAVRDAYVAGLTKKENRVIIPEKITGRLVE